MKNYIDPFPLEKLKNLRFGDADGGLDKYLTERTFIQTFSVSTFLQDEHSIIVGPFGSGKSALFKLLQEKSNLLESYLKYSIIPIQEAVSFYELKLFIEEKFATRDKKHLYYLIWKFQIAVKLASNIYEHSSTNFPQTKMEEDINDFLKLANSKYKVGTLETVKNLFGDEFFIGFEVNETPIGISYKNKQDKKQISLDYIIDICEKIILEKKMKPALIIIDKLDKFVAGEEYEVQRMYIEALLEINDDIRIKYNKISLKIFLRADLFTRLNLEPLGWDKVNDSVLRIKWSSQEIIHFLAKRILFAFEEEKIFNEYNILNEIRLQTDINIFDMSTFDLLLFSFKKDIINNYLIDKYVKKNKYAEQDLSTKQKISRQVITKVFPHHITHKNANCDNEEISIFEFIETHFLNGHNESSPRNILLFMKHLNRVAINYYEQNPDHEVFLQENIEIKEYPLYLKKFIHIAYQEIIDEFIKTISKADNKWTKYFGLFLQKRGKKLTFDYNWVHQKLENISEEDINSFFAYMEHIGFLKIKDNHADIKKRKYCLPLIYMKTCI